MNEIEKVKNIAMGWRPVGKGLYGKMTVEGDCE